MFTFGLLLSLLEDSGYLNAAAYLADSVMRPLGLNGRAIIPMISGTGCNVQAILGTRILASRLERFIASALIALVPCSARIAVILGPVGAVSDGLRRRGWARLAPHNGGRGCLPEPASSGERPGDNDGDVPLRRPPKRRARPYLVKFSGFMREAVPYMLWSLVVGFLYETETMTISSGPSSL